MQVFGLIGNPVSHSLSPPMHEVAYDEHGLDARYVTFEPDESDLETAIQGARALGIRGLNVTIPFKQAVLEFCEPDDLATRIGAVNTLDFGGEEVTGHNTDAVGVTRAFAHHDVPLAGRAVVVGAGGAGRAAAFALADEGVEVTIANRTVETAHNLAAAVDGASGHGLDELSGLVADADLLVNATSVGMEADESPVPESALHADLRGTRRGLLADRDPVAPGGGGGGCDDGRRGVDAALSGRRRLRALDRPLGTRRGNEPGASGTYLSLGRADRVI